MNLQEVMDAVQSAGQARTEMTMRDGTEVLVVHYPLRSYAMTAKPYVHHANALRQFLQSRITEEWVKLGLIDSVVGMADDADHPAESKWMCFQANNFGVTGVISLDGLGNFGGKVDVSVNIWLRAPWLHRMMLDFPLFSDMLMISATGDEFPEGTKEEDRKSMLTLVASELIEDVSYMEEFCIDFVHEYSLFRQATNGAQVAIQWHINKLIKERMKQCHRTKRSSRR